MRYAQRQNNNNNNASSLLPPLSSRPGGEGEAGNGDGHDKKESPDPGEKEDIMMMDATPSANQGKGRPRPSSESASVRERSKSINTVASRMKQVVEKLIRQQQEHPDMHQRLTVFLYRNQQAEIANAFFQEMQKESPDLLNDKDRFMALLGMRYDEFRSSSSIITSMPSSSAALTRC